jgi:hypothetical protein
LEPVTSSARELHEKKQNMGKRVPRTLTFKEPLDPAADLQRSNMVAASRALACVSAMAAVEVASAFVAPTPTLAAARRAAPINLR